MCLNVKTRKRSWHRGANEATGKDEHASTNILIHFLLIFTAQILDTGYNKFISRHFSQFIKKKMIKNNVDTKVTLLIVKKYKQEYICARVSVCVYTRVFVPGPLYSHSLPTCV